MLGDEGEVAVARGSATNFGEEGPVHSAADGDRLPHHSGAGLDEEIPADGNDVAVHASEKNRSIGDDDDRRLKYRVLRHGDGVASDDACVRTREHGREVAARRTGTGIADDDG